MIETEVAHFWGFVVERDLVWQRREAGYPPPWTNDPFIGKFWFTNVHRDRDVGTRWIVDRVTSQPPPTIVDVLFQLVCYRSLNRLSTYVACDLPLSSSRGHFDQWYERVDELAKHGAVGSAKHYTSMRRLPMVMESWETHGDKVTEQVWGAQDGVEAVGYLVDLKGLGPFTSLQVVADFVELPWHGAHMTRETLIPLAVGSRLALHLLMTGEYLLDTNTHETGNGRKARGASGLLPDQREFLTWLRLTQPPTLSKPLTYVDIEHSLCEWNKYRRHCAGDPPQAQSAIKYPFEKVSA